MAATVCLAIGIVIILSRLVETPKINRWNAA